MAQLKTVNDSVIDSVIGVVCAHGVVRRGMFAWCMRVYAYGGCVCAYGDVYAYGGCVCAYGEVCMHMGVVCVCI